MTGALSYINLWTDEPRIGCGYRPYLVIHRGRKWAALLYLPTLTRIRVPLASLAKGDDCGPMNWKRVAKRIRTTRRDRKRWGLPFSEAGVAEALSLLEH